ncbi:hypothetical protein DFJ63DRAFT_319690 [Scheffersomyces coipomensis]|uniref:uncharacterized protein n=1 Tax=Scheffersomyces coipomensis TaxID=1788519 RepID=UPI00315DAE41
MSNDYNFDDVIPVEINTEQPQLCQILYDDEYKTTMGILLALLKNEEYSERALYITQKGIELLASHYTIWIYRYDILTKLNKDLFEELDWCEQVALENEKNYQIWNYRQLIIDRILKTSGDEKEGSTKRKYEPHREFPILEAMLDSDPKNHHVWSYRKWLVEKFDLFNDPKELEFVDKCILADLRNNSAWNHRYFLKFAKVDLITEESVKNELQYVESLIEQLPQNPSSWNYLIGIYQKQGLKLSGLEDFCLKFINLKELELNDNSFKAVKSLYALEMLAKIFLERKDYKDSIKVYDLLGTQYDTIRSNYWKYEKSKVETIVGGTTH